MKKEAEIYIEEDRKKKELIEARNLAENLVYTCQKTLKDAGDKIDKGIKDDIEEKIKGLEKAKDSDNIEDIKAKTSELSTAIQKAGAEMYKNAKPEEKPEQKQEKPKEEGGAQEGEYKEK